ncbi:MAG: aminotransferase class I/II-fold pyridoxal phosphate-dependent enzyme [candidate division Zixibacteria bacterium]|nr:aminotransferase class I/II-fold pyridoxal phosphate-dependent enzyme [candidate division Zixibacteria bacterium]
MRVLLVRPPVPKYTIGLKHVMICEPLELEYLAAGLKDHEVEILDLILERDFEVRLWRFRPEVVGLSCYISGVNEVIKLCRLIKRWNRECLTVVGGVHASVAPEDFADPAVDCICLGEGCATMARVVAARRNGHALVGLPGLAIPSGPQQVIRTAPAPYMIEPDSLPLPRRDLTAHLRSRYYYLFHQPVATMKTTWGCWYNCDFCMTWNVTGGQAYSRSPESIVRELESIRESEVYIVDDIFLINSRRLLETARLIREKGIRKRFLVYGRADYIAESEDVIRVWADIGLTAVIVGLEANTHDELASLGKKTTTDQNRLAVEILRRHRIDTYASLIAQPWYERSDWERLFSFIREAGLYYVNISPLTPLPGSPLFKRSEAILTIPRQAHGLWDLTHCVLPTGMSLKQYYRELLRLYARTVLSLRRAAHLTLRTRPPVWSLRYLRLWLGAARIFIQFINAHRHHTGRGLKRAMDRGIPNDGLGFQGATIQLSDSREEESASFGYGNEKIQRVGGPADDGRWPLDPYHGYFRDHPVADDGGHLLDLPSARRWRKVVSWGIAKRLYTYQQPFDRKAGPVCTLDGREYRMASSYDYLGLLGHPEIEAAACDAIRRYGTGTGGVRLLTGSTALHHELDETIAHFKGVEACASFSSGYVANLAVISALFRSGDRAILDSHAHRSISDACRMALVQTETFAHNDLEALEDALRTSHRCRRTLVVVEGVYSMDGDTCPLPEIVALRKRYGFFLMVDEAHSFGALGATGRGVDEHYGVSPGDVDIWMGSLSKAIPSCGGFIAGSRELIIYLHHGSAPFMFSAAAAPATAATALAAIKVLRREPWRVKRLSENASFLKSGLSEMRFNTGTTASHVIPVIIGSDEATYAFSQALFKRGTVALGIVAPAVAHGSARLRLCATAAQNRELLSEVLADFRVCRGTLKPKDNERAYMTQGDG